MANAIAAANPTDANVATTVPLSDGRPYPIKRLSFAGYRAVKNRVFELIAGPLADELANLIRTIGPHFEKFIAGDREWTDADTAALLPVLFEALESGMPRLLATLGKYADELGDTFVAGCIDDAPETFNVVDWLDIRAAAMEANDFAAIVDKEKNFYRATFNQIVSTIGSKSPRPNGGSNTNIASPTPTAGPATK